MPELVLKGLSGLPEILQDVDLIELLVNALRRTQVTLQAGDIIVLAQKIVSKAEGRAVRLADVQPSARAHELARECAKDPRLVELILRESREVLRVKPGIIIVEHRLGFVMANAGIDQSNVPGDDVALLLPHDPDASARALRTALCARSGMAVGVLIIDSFGRAWRHGVTGIAIGVAGVPALIDQRGARDREGRVLKVTQVAAADELAAAASLVMGQADEGVPAVLARGFPYTLTSGTQRESAIADVIRPKAEDLFR